MVSSEIPTDVDANGYSSTGGLLLLSNEFDALQLLTALFPY
ncbi:hypothetical protein REH76_17660 [Photobacterium damselae]